MKHTKTASAGYSEVTIDEISKDGMSDENSSLSSQENSISDSVGSSDGLLNENHISGSIIIYMDEINNYDNCSFTSQKNSYHDEECNLADEIFDDVELIVTGCLSESSTAFKFQEELEIMSKRALERAMNTNQEVWNAVTMLIAPCYCLYYLLSGHWLTSADIAIIRIESLDPSYSFNSFNGNIGCIQSSIFPKFHALPPLTVMAIIVGMVLHAPVSITYHLLCAFKIPQGPQRINHWSRRLDQAMIHVISILWSFGSSGNWKYALLSMMFNVDSIYGLYQRPFCPKKIARRFGVAMIMQSLPLFTSGDCFLIAQLLTIFAVSGWLFTRYPFGGYSHGMFHIVIALAPPLVLAASAKLPSGQDQILYAGKCALSNLR